MLVLRGTVVTMRPGGAVLDQGEVYAGDDGLIAAVTPGDPVPAGFQGAPRVAAGGLIYPGLIDLHNHLLYNSLPLWTEPSRTSPWTSHNQWVDADSYPTAVSAPARLLGAAAGRALLRYVETRAMVGGTTCIHGNPKGTPPPDGDLRERVLREGPLYDFLYTTGCALRRDFLEAVLPVPEAPYRNGADVYLITLAPVFGQLRTLPGPGGTYRATR